MEVPVHIGESYNTALIGFANAKGYGVKFLIEVFVEEYFKEEDPGNLPIATWERLVPHKIDLSDETVAKIVVLSESEFMPFHLALRGIVENRILDRQTS